MDETIGALTWRRVVPVLLMLVGIVGGLVYTLLATPTYTARTLVIISTDLARTQARAETLAQGFGKAITTPDVLNAAAATLKIPPQDVARSVQQSVSPESPLVELTATAPSAQGAADIVNAVAKGLVDLVNAQKQPGVTVALLGGQAVPPAAPSSPNLVIDLAVGASAGVLLGVLFLVSGAGRPRSARGGSAAPAAAGTPAAPASAPFPVVPGPPAAPPPPPGEGVTVRVTRPKLPQRWRPPPQRRPTPGAAGGVPPVPRRPAPRPPASADGRAGPPAHPRHRTADPSAAPPSHSGGAPPTAARSAGLPLGFARARRVRCSSSRCGDADGGADDQQRPPHRRPLPGAAVPAAVGRP